MRSRGEIKQMAKQAFGSRYWLCVGVLVLYSLILSAASGTFAIAVILTGPMLVGLSMFCIQLQLGMNVNIGTMFTGGFSLNFGRKVGAYWWRVLFTWLWSLLFVIPGIVKSFSYAMQPYILADCPGVTAGNSLKLSMRMMNGHKGELFVLYLSFLGWFILSGLTCGILMIFYVGPYFNQTVAQYYLEVKQDSLNRGVIAPEELYPTV